MEIQLNQDERLDIVNDGIKIIQRKNGLVFGSDALLLAGYIKGNPKFKAVELGGGTGIISLLISKRHKANSIYIYELQPQFAELCKRNAELNQLANLTVLNKDVRNACAADCLGEADIVFSNPPYMKMGCGKENIHAEKNIARRETAGDIGDFCKAASKLLKFGGSFYVVYLTERLNELMSSLTENKLEPKKMTLVCPDYNKRPCIVLIEAKKGGNKGMIITPPLFIKENGEESPDYKYIMEKGYFNELY